MAQGELVRSAVGNGKAVVLNAWGSTCGPCAAEAPGFAAVAKDTEATGVRFVGINRASPPPSPLTGTGRTVARSLGTLAEGDLRKMTAPLIAEK